MKALLLEDGNHSAALSIVRALGRLGHEVVVAAPFETPASCSRWCRRRLLSPRVRDRECYTGFLLSLLNHDNYDVGFTCDDSVAELVSTVREGLPSRPDFLLPPAESLEIARNKVTAQRLAADLGVPTPRTVPLDRPGRLGEACALGFPLVVKDSKGSGGRHVRYPASPEELRQAYEELTGARHLGQPMAQEFIPGQGYLTQVLYQRGRLLAICSHRKDRQFPVRGGVTAKGVTVNEPELDAQAERLFSALRWHGAAKADFKRDPRDGQFKLMELDPRISTSVGIAEAAGVPMIAICCALAAGAELQPRLAYRKGVPLHYNDRELLCLAARPGLFLPILLDALDPRVRSDLDWRDLPGTFGLVRRTVWLFDEAWRRGQITANPGHAPAGAGWRGELDRLTPSLVGRGLLAAGALYRAVRSVRHTIASGSPASKGSTPEGG